MKLDCQGSPRLWCRLSLDTSHQVLRQSNQMKLQWDFQESGQLKPEEKMGNWCTEPQSFHKITKEFYVFIGILLSQYSPSVQCGAPFPTQALLNVMDAVTRLGICFAWESHQPLPGSSQRTPTQLSEQWVSFTTDLPPPFPSPQHIIKQCSINSK